MEGFLSAAVMRALIAWGSGEQGAEGLEWATVRTDESQPRVLHVDDDDAYRGAVASVLDGVSLDTAAFVAETGVILDEREFDCVVLDHRLPDGTGVELLRQDAFGDTPVVFLTGQGDETLAAEAIHAGAAEYFPKGTGPDGMRAVAEAVQRHASEYRQSRDVVRLHRRCELAADVVADAVFEWRVDDDEATLHGGEPFGYDAFSDVFDVGWWRERLHPDDRQRVLADFEAVFTENIERHEIEYRFRRADGGYADVRMTSRFIYGETKTLGVGVLADVSERKARERELKRRNERLDRLAGVVSHDLRNPLSVAEGYLQLARETGEKAHLEEVAAALDRIDELIEDLLELAQTGRGVTELGPVSLSSVTKEAWESVTMDGHALRVVDDATVRADRSRLRQLFENLFRNAIEHGATGDRTRPDDSDEHHSTDSRAQSAHTPERDAATDASVTVTVGTLDDGFYVADDGVGIPDDIEDTLFEAGVTGSTDGTGFGLAIVREVVESHDWRVTAPTSDYSEARFEVRGVEFD